MDRLFELAIEFRRRFVPWCLFDSLTGQINRHAGFWPTHVRDPFRRHEHTVAAPPIARVHYEVANRPGVIVNQEIFQMANVTIRCPDVMTDDGVTATQVAIIGGR